MGNKKFSLRKKWLDIVLVMVIILFVMFVFGYFAKGLYNKDFDLAACWAGVAAIASVSAAGLGNYYLDKKNKSGGGDA